MRAGGAEVEGEVFGTGDPSPTGKAEGAAGEWEVDYLSVKNRRFLPPPLTRGGKGAEEDGGAVRGWRGGFWDVGASPTGRMGGAEQDEGGWETKEAGKG